MALLLTLNLLPPLALAKETVAPLGGERKILKITGYYSPLPNQSKYVRGNYESDIRLNGRGTNGADGTEVYPGMLAAPHTYPFGTQIFIPGLGMGTVHDRGGAIVPAGQRSQSYDRIDVWMGTGEDGLARALQWGVRTVEGVVYSQRNSSADSLFSFASVPTASLAFLSNTSVKQSHISVASLQKNLGTLGFYFNSITGVYDESTKKAVLDFQIKNNVVASINDFGAGVFGPKTRSMFLSTFAKFQEKSKKTVSHLSRYLPAGMSSGSSGGTVVHLHQVMQTMGYFSGEMNEKFTDTTEKAVQNFQLAYGIISSESEYGSGVFGPKTQKKLFKIFSGREKTLTNSTKSQVIAQEFIGEKKESFVAGENKKEEAVSSPSVLVKEFPKSPDNVYGNGVASHHPLIEGIQVTTFRAVKE